MADYLVTWEINVSADDAVDAARQAKAIQMESEHRATVFKVCDFDGKEETIDLEEYK
jgi:hypothetical protein